MALHISEVSRKKSEKCPYAFQCLEEGRNICEVGIYIEGDGLFLKKAKYAKCPYKKFGNKRSHYQCSCPTRMELYKRYKI